MKLEERALLEKIRIDIESAEGYFESYIKPKLVERYQIYNADPDYYAQKFPKLGKRSTVVSTDVADVIEWALPSLMRIFFGGEDVVTIKGRQAEDERKAELMQELINFQIQVQNPGFMIFYRWFKDALVSGLGVIKCWWERETEDFQMKGLFSIEEAEAMKQAENIEIVKVEPTENNVYAIVTYKLKKIKKNQPVFTNIPPNEFIYHPDASNIKDATFVAHRKLVTADYLRKKVQEGIYDEDAVEEAIRKGQEQENVNWDELSLALRPNQSQFTPPQVDEARKIFKLYECYTKYDINNDGLLEPVIVTVVNDTILRVEENLYGRPPFFVLAPILEPYEIWGKSFSDILADIQAIKTALIRQILVNIALNNDPKLEVLETAVNLQDLVLDKEFIRVRQLGAIRPLPIQPLASWTYDFLEYIEGLKENRTGVTRYNQGLDARSLNKRIDINTPVPMANGTWKLLKDIQDGDIILGGDGKPTKVIKAHEIAFCEDAYELEFSNGAKIKADAEHLWGVYVYNRYHVLTTAQIKKLFKQGKPIYIPRPERIYSGQEKELPIDPYVLGVWLGDGHKYSARLTIADGEIVERVKDWCEKQGWEISEDRYQNAGQAKTYLITSKKDRKRDEKGRFIAEDSFHKRLADLGIYSRTGGTPHIPAIYFTASYKQRLELLRGLMDTDGCWSKAGIAIFCTSNYRLAEDVVKLVRSLGGNPHLKKVRKKGKELVNGRECNVKEHWQVKFNLFDCPFYVSRKAKEWKAPKKLKTYRLVAIKKTKGCLMRCLTVDNPDGLWLVGEHYIATHNTATGVRLIMAAAQQRLELIARIFAETGIKEFFRFLIELNQRFITQDIVIRLTNERLQISPEDIRGEFDLEVSAGVGVGVKEQQLQNLEMIMQIYPQLAQVGIVTPKNIYNIAKKFIEALGFKNVDDFLTDPEKIQQQLLQQGGLNAVAGNRETAGASVEEILPLLESQRLTESVSGVSGRGKKANIPGVAAEEKP
ncbi:MAG: hypothetical protein DRP00_03005 [Candidatus Aenigmatarchaeota archaeon]|nr:MAG: hypothetical protein DRP00_03005 [Candidatus Aenigmarchaeota archaeon]